MVPFAYVRWASRSSQLNFYWVDWATTLLNIIYPFQTPRNFWLSESHACVHGGIHRVSFEVRGSVKVKEAYLPFAYFLAQRELNYCFCIHFWILTFYFLLDQATKRNRILCTHFPWRVDKEQSRVAEAEVDSNTWFVFITSQSTAVLAKLACKNMKHEVEIQRLRFPME